MMNNLVISDIMSIFASSKRRRSQNLFYTLFTYVNRQTLRIEVENVLHLLFYILKKEKAKEEGLDGYGRTSYL